MRISDLTETITNMAELASLTASVRQTLNTIETAKVQLMPNLNQVGVQIRLIDTKELVTVYYQLRSNDTTQFRNQVAAALRSDQRGKLADYRQDVMKSIDGRTLRGHALNFLMNDTKWQPVNMRYNNQTLTFKG